MGRSTQQQEPVSAGLAVERAARVIRDLPEDVPRKSATRIVTNTLKVVGVEPEGLSDSCEAKQTELQAEIDRSQQRISELERDTDEAIRSLQEQISRAREVRDARLLQEQQDIEQASSEISYLRLLRNFALPTRPQEPDEPPGPAPSDDDEPAEVASDQVEPTSGQETRPETAFGRWRTTYGVLCAAALLLALLSLGTLAYFASGQHETGTGSRPEAPSPEEVPQGSPSREAAAGSEGPERFTGEEWDRVFARNPLPSLATPREGASMDYDGRIALTFDDGPDPGTTPAILDLLDERDLRATFFVSGERVRQNPDLVRRMVREGHTLGNHTHSHRDMSELSPVQMRREIQSTERAVERALGRDYEMRLMRPPYGAPYYSGQSGLSPFRGVMSRMEIVPVMWTIDSRDWEFGDRPNAIARNVVRRTGEGGGVLLLHDTSEGTAEALPRIIARYERRGFEFASVSEMLDDKYGVGTEEQSPEDAER